jgi:hypothetical protein
VCGGCVAAETTEETHHSARTLGNKTFFSNVVVGKTRRVVGHKEIVRTNYSSSFCLFVLLSNCSFARLSSFSVSVELVVYQICKSLSLGQVDFTPHVSNLKNKERIK